VVSYDDQALQVETTATPSTSGTKRRNRTKNTVPSMVFTVDAVGPAGDPIEPSSVVPKFHNTVGALVRTWMEPSISDWRKVTGATKTFLWTELQKVFRYPRGVEEVATAYTLKQFGQAYRRWRSDLNTKYVQQNLTPFNEYALYHNTKLESDNSRYKYNTPSIPNCRSFDFFRSKFDRLVLVLSHD